MDQRELKRRKAYLLAEEIGLVRSERLDLACYLLRRDVTSWTQLDESQIERMLDALEGYHLIQTLKEWPAVA